MKTLARYLKSRYAMAIRYSDVHAYVDAFCFEGFGAVELFIMLHPELKEEAEKLWENFRSQLEELG